MKRFQYHEGQRTLQREARTEEIADRLKPWVGVIRNAALADLIVMAQQNTSAPVQFTAISGKPSLVETYERNEQIYLRFPQQLRDYIKATTPVGGLLITPGEGLRSRFSGVLAETGGQIDMECEIAFSNCRKYIAPSVPLADDMKFGPASGSR
jgi:hypothetical protein